MNNAGVFGEIFFFRIKKIPKLSVTLLKKLKCTSGHLLVCSEVFISPQCKKTGIHLDCDKKIVLLFIQKAHSFKPVLFSCPVLSSFRWITLDYTSLSSTFYTQQPEERPWLHKWHLVFIHVCCWQMLCLEKSLAFIANTFLPGHSLPLLRGHWQGQGRAHGHTFTDHPLRTDVTVPRCIQNL